jgi:predicted O-linked N-acetylglucosamine transferase (SPINDLY family)
MILPHAWYPLGAQAFRPEPQADPQSPFQRNGYVTFGTANNPNKYSLDLIEAWAGALNKVPESRFMFIRPEGGSKAFTSNLTALFGRWGIAPERIIFEAVRGRHMPFYNEIDISLDTFPQTGGTTTCESLWMGVPVVTLVGPAMFERLSYSVLMNLDLPELCTRTPQEYVAAAAALANDRPRLNELRRTLRPRMVASHLGRTKEFAADYFEAIETAVRQAGVAASRPVASSST